VKDIQKDREICEKATPGPWEWRGNTNGKSLLLISRVGMRDIVMDFDRWGMQSCIPGGYPVQLFYEDGIYRGRCKKCGEVYESEVRK